MKWTPEQTKANRQRWTEALRSGRFEQTTGMLRRVNNSYCCLGVACSLFAADFPEVLTPEKDSDSRYRDSNGEVWDTDLPPFVAAYLGLDAEGGGFTIASEVGREWVKHLALLNDKGWTFDQIADFIDSEPLGLVEN